MSVCSFVFFTGTNYGFFIFVFLHCSTKEWQKEVLCALHCSTKKERQKEVCALHGFEYSCTKRAAAVYCSNHPHPPVETDVRVCDLFANNSERRESRSFQSFNISFCELNIRRTKLFQKASNRSITIAVRGVVAVASRGLNTPREQSISLCDTYIRK